jgi:hypothetical protein
MTVSAFSTTNLASLSCRLPSIYSLQLFRLNQHHVFISASGWYLYIETSRPRKPNDTARLISPSTTESKSCLRFFYHMYGRDVNELRVFIFILCIYLFISVYLLTFPNSPHASVMASWSGDQGFRVNTHAIYINVNFTFYRTLVIIEYICYQNKAIKERKNSLSE